ncbi:MAG: [FeFe] hydrogenase H-cluster radical SAM maturase HydE [Eubacteriaceae bacterium]
MKELVEKLFSSNTLTRNEIEMLLGNLNTEIEDYLFTKARLLTDKVFGRNIYIRGLLEFTNHCYRNCLYCGIRKNNTNVLRYRFYEDEILNICEKANVLGFKTFVLQGGEDPFYNDDKMEELVYRIRKLYPDIAITLSIGERDEAIYRRLKLSGANRFLLRHETINRSQYNSFHPGMSYDERIKCIKTLKKLGYQTGVGFLIGLPGQKLTDYVDDLMFIKDLNPEMVGIGPFIPHKDTPLNYFRRGSVKTTLVMLSIIRLLLPKALIPSSTALNTLSYDGCYSGFDAGANVLMLNITPAKERENYSLYEGKAEVDVVNSINLQELKNQMKNRGYILDMSMGDYKY